jgi:hypothetical protein
VSAQALELSACRTVNVSETTKTIECKTANPNVIADFGPFLRLAQVLPTPSAPGNKFHTL